jgi:hypothetical protein
MTVSLSMLAGAGTQFFDNNGVPLAGGLLYTYSAGSVTPATTYRTSSGSGGASNSNPIVLDSAGRVPYQIWLTDGVSYKFVIKDIGDNLIRTEDNVYGASVKNTDNIVKVVATFNDLASTTATIGQQVSILGHTVAGYGGGIFNCVSSAGLVADNGRTVINGDIAFVRCAHHLTAEDFGAYPGLADISPMLQSAINAIPSGKTGAVTLVSDGSVYNVSQKILIVNRNICLDFSGATLYLNDDVDYMFYIDGENIKLTNVTINRDHTKTVTACIYATGLQHRFDNITSRDQKWPIFFNGVNLKESHFTNIRVDLDVATRLGDIFRFDYCVNNTMDQSFLGYCDRFIYGSSAVHPTSGYANEGMSLTNIICVYAKRTVTYDRVTSLSIGSGCVFDFCETWGVFCTNGNNLTVAPGVWIASNLTNGFIGVGTGGTFSDAHVDGLKCVRGASAISGTAGVSLSGPNAKVTGCSFTSGMNGGVVTMGGAVYGNSVEAPGTAINAISATTDIVGTLTVNGVAVFAPNVVSGSATLGANGGLPAQVYGYLSIPLGANTYKIPLYNV